MPHTPVCHLQSSLPISDGSRACLEGEGGSPCRAPHPPFLTSLGPSLTCPFPSLPSLPYPSPPSFHSLSPPSPPIPSSSLPSPWRGGPGDRPLALRGSAAGLDLYFSFHHSDFTCVNASDYYDCTTCLGRQTTTSDHYVCTTSLGRQTTTSDHYVCTTSLGRQTEMPPVR